MKSNFWLLAPILFSTSLIAKAVNKVDVLAVEYPPFTTLNQPSGGISFELLYKATKDLGIEWQPYFVPPKRAYKMVDEGNWCASFYPIHGNNAFIRYNLSDTPINIGLIRLLQEKPFAWNKLNEYSGKTIAVLSSGNDIYYAKMFEQAGLTMVQVQTVHAAVQMVILKRVDYAMVDNFSFESLESKNKNKLQFSESLILQTQPRIFINSNCDIKIPSLKASQKKQIEPSK